MSKQLIIHDLKTERTDILQPLPGALRLLPLLFMASIVGAIGITAHSFVQMKSAQEEARVQHESEATFRQLAESLKIKADEVQKEWDNAKSVQQWLAGSTQMQPVILTIARSMKKGSTIDNLSLNRRDEDPSQIMLTIRINKGGTQQVDDLQTSLQTTLAYRTFSDNTVRVKNSTDVDFSCTLVNKSEESN